MTILNKLMYSNGLYYKYRKYLLITILSSFLFSSCVNKNKRLCEGNSAGLFFKFELPASISPSIDTFKLGDTLYIENSFSENLLNKNSNKIYPVLNFDFGLEYYIYCISSNPITGASYNIIPLIGNSEVQTLTAGKVVGIKHLYSNGYYNYKAGIVMDKPGLYMFQFNSFIARAKNLASQDKHVTQCPEEQMELTMNLNSKEENNYYLIQNSLDSNIRNLQKSDFDAGGCHCYYVKP